MYQHLNIRRIILTLAGLLCFAGAFAQDIIVKKNGDEVSAKILEVAPDFIKYKRFDYPDGPVISVLKQDVFMIKYANGTKETFNAKPAPAANHANATGYPEIQEHIKLGGPRIGFTVIGGKQVSKLQEDYDVNPFLTQFGWQFETRMFTTSGGLSGLAEFVPLIGGLEQGKFIPSLNALVGIRSAKGLEFGVGPNVSPTGAGLVFAVGTSFHSQGINFPVNLAVVPGNDGVRFSLLFGFNSRKN